MHYHDDLHRSNSLLREEIGEVLQFTDFKWVSIAHFELMSFKSTFLIDGLRPILKLESC